MEKIKLVVSEKREFEFGENPKLKSVVDFFWYCQCSNAMKKAHFFSGKNTCTSRRLAIET